MSTPLDVKPCWFNFIRRLQSVGAQNNGYAIITISVVIDADGDPKLWTEPRVTKLEPKRIDDVLAILAQTCQ